MANRGDACHTPIFCGPGWACLAAAGSRRQRPVKARPARMRPITPRPIGIHISTIVSRLALCPACPAVSVTEAGV